MPGLNRRGPMGEGPMTGRKMGQCNPDNKGKTDDEILQNRSSSLEPGRGMGRGQGLGSGLGIGRGQGGLGRGLGRQNRFRGGN
ncbi:MAG: DUF5320 domain-containing protein [Bacteroidota bacterium]|nr:DUF5320 domain-containing protein [Bacteroidota bacterium]